MVLKVFEPITKFETEALLNIPRNTPLVWLA